MANEKIAVISDVHANKYALKAFLDHVKARGDITSIWNLGDFLQIGPHPKEVADVVLNDPRFVNILGANELSLLHRHLPDFRVDEAAHQNWTINQVGPDVMLRLATLPEMREIYIDDWSVLLLHSLDNLPAEVDVGWVFSGKTHAQVHAYRGRTVLINPGTLGCAGTSVMQFVVAEVRDRGLSVSFEILPYDGSNLTHDYTVRQVPDAAHILQTYFKK